MSLRILFKSEKVYKSIRKKLEDQGYEILNYPDRIYSIEHMHEGENIVEEVGSVNPITHETIAAIFCIVNGSYITVYGSGEKFDYCGIPIKIEYFNPFSYNRLD